MIFVFDRIVEKAMFSNDFGIRIIKSWDCVRVNPLPDEKILDWSTLKEIADDI